jgi:hypothetical protein
MRYTASHKFFSGISLFCLSFSALIPSFLGMQTSLAQNIEKDTFPFPKTVFEKTERQINNPKEQFDRWEWRRTNSVLEAEQQGGFSLLSSSNDISQGLDILTGNASMNDSMQLGDFSSGQENQQQFLENLTEAIEAYKQNSDEGEYPESLADFAKYPFDEDNQRENRWATIQMGSGWNAPRKNISEVADLVEYKRVLFTTTFPFSEIKKESYSKNEAFEIINRFAGGEDVREIRPPKVSFVEIPSGEKNTDEEILKDFVKKLETASGKKLALSTTREGNGNIAYTIDYSPGGDFILPSEFTVVREKSNNEESDETEVDPLMMMLTDESRTEEAMNILANQQSYSTFSLSIKPQAFDIPLPEVQTIETKSHDFEELIKELSEEEKKNIETIPEIYSLIPADTFSVYFSDSEKYREFSETMNNPLSELSQISPLPSVGKMEELIGKRLNIGDPKKFLGTITEFAFVGEDIRIYPSSDFAIIFKCKSNELCEIFGAEKVGEYFVLATHKKILENFINECNAEFPEFDGCEGISMCMPEPKLVCTVKIRDKTSLKDELDFQYSWAVTENRRDGFIFFSDAFIRKMVSPEYRINLRRQKSVVESMNALQYIVWVYKKNEQKFPENLQELEEKNYISKNSLYQKEKYSLDPKTGIVKHEIWGTPFDITPLTRVSIDTISKGEKTWYETGVDQYQSNYQEFFDPIGISITVADKIAFHTVILPLSANEEYKIIETIGGNISKEHFELAGTYPTAAEGVMSFDIDEILYQAGLARMGGEEKFQEFLKDDKNLQNCLEDDDILEEACNKIFDPKIPEKERLIMVAEQDLLEEFYEDGFLKEFNNKDTFGKTFDFLGDEIMLGFGENMKFDFDSYDTSGIDIFLTLKLNDSQKAEEFFLAIVKAIGNEMRGNRGFRMFQMNKPIKNHHNEKEYYSLPLGPVSIFVFFDEDRVSFAVSQNTILSMIGENNAENTGSENNQENFARLHQFLSGTKNILLTGDTKKIINWLEIIPEEMQKEFNKEIARDIFETQSWRDNRHSYEGEYFLLQEVLGEEFMKNHFSQYPVKLGYKGVFKDSNQENATFVWQNIETGEEISEQQIGEKVDIISLLTTSLSSFGEAGLTFAFTEHGAEIKIAFDNASNNTIDERFENISGKNTLSEIFSGENSDLIKNIGIGSGIILIGGILFILARKKII